jgi:hypothetical protein
VNSKLTFILLIILISSSAIQAKDLSCSHYLHKEVAGMDVGIIQWQETIKINLGESEKDLKEKIGKNKALNETIIKMIKGGQKVAAKIEFEKASGKSLSPAEPLEQASIQFAKVAVIEKELIKLKKNTYSEMTLKHVAKIEELDGGYDITEGLILTVLNKLSNVTSTYYHGLNSNSLFTPDARPRTLNDYRLDLNNYKLKDAQFGEIKAVSYKCVYPSIAPTTSDLEKEYEKLIANAKNQLNELRTKIKANKIQSQIKDNDNYPSESANTSGGNSTAK